MSKVKTIQTVEDNGVNFGQIISPQDIVKSQEFAHLHSENLTRDFLTALYETDVAGFEVTVAGLSINVYPGRIYQSGWQFDSDELQLTVATPDTEFDRIDLIVATVVQNSPEQQTFIPFQRIRTQLELQNNTPPYPPVQYEVPLEKHNKAVVSIKTGVPSADPQQPALAEGEIALYAVTVPADATALIPANFTDLRRHAVNLRYLKTQVDQLIASLSAAQTSINTLLAYQYDQVPVLWSSSFGGTRTIHAVFEELAGNILVLRYRYPSMLTVDGRIQAVGNLDNGTPVIDIPIGTIVQFGDKFVTITPDSFTDPSLNARQLTTGLNNTDPLFDGLTEAAGVDDGNGNTVRINAPNSIKWLFLNRDGQIFFRDILTSSNSNECLLLRSTPKGANAPELLTYYNLRTGVVVKSGLADGTPESTQYVNDIALPVGIGYARHYGVKESDKSHYSLDPLSTSGIDAVVNVGGVAEGDTWIVELNLFSVY